MPDTTSGCAGVKLVVDEGTRLVTAVNVTKTALLLVQNATHVEITGGGVLYGNAEYYIDYFIPSDDEYAPTSPDGGRPRLLFVRQSRDVYIHNINVMNASDWHVHIQGSRDVAIDQVRASTLQQHSIAPLAG